VEFDWINSYNLEIYKLISNLSQILEQVYVGHADIENKLFRDSGR